MSKKGDPNREALDGLLSEAQRALVAAVAELEKQGKDGYVSMLLRSKIEVDNVRAWTGYARERQG